MRPIIFIPIVFTLSINLNAQIKGQVLDIRKNPVPYANVILYAHPTEDIVAGVLTDPEGHFEIPIKRNGNYMMRISLLSYKSWTSEVFSHSTADPFKNFGVIQLEEEALNLNEIEITAKRKLIENTPEGQVLNVQESILAKGSSALQLLERAPGVILDQRNNSFSLNGKNGTIIMINNKVMRIPTADLITMLNGMSADNIHKIELLTNPSARYDADGNAGIINILLIKNESLGTKGNYSITGGYGEGVKHTSSISLNHGGKRFSTFGTYSFSYDDTFSNWIGRGNTDISALGGDTNIVFSSRTAQLLPSHNSTAGIEFGITDSSSIGASFLYNYSNPSTQTMNRGMYDFVSDPFLDAQIHLQGKAAWHNFNSSIFYESNRKNRSFAITADYIYYNNKNPNTVRNQYFDINGREFQPDNDIYTQGNRGINATKINIGVLKTDYKKVLSDDVSIEGGLKGSYSKTLNEARIETLIENDYVQDQRFNGNRTINESIFGSYLLTDVKLTETLSLQGGIRYEFWNQDFDDTSLDRKFGKLFPSLFMKKTFSDIKNLQFAYTKRIARPNYADLASNVSYNSPNSVFSGNPELLSNISNSIRLTYTYKSYSFGLIASKDENPIARYQITRSPLSELAVIAPVNLKYQNSLDFQLNVPLKFSNWFSLNFNGTIGMREFRLLHTDERLKHDYLHYNFNFNQTIKLPKKISLEISGWYTSNHFNGSIRVEGFGSLNTGIKKQFANGASLQFSVTDVLESINITSRIGSLTREAFGDVFTVNYKPESTNSRIFKLTYAYNFGNKKVKNATKKSGADEEKSRTRN